MSIQNIKTMWSNSKTSPQKDEVERIHLQPFDPDTMPPGSLAIVIGRRYSGKSYAVRHIMHMCYLRGMPVGAIFSGTEHVSPFFGDYFPDSFIWNDEDLTDERIHELLKGQENACHEWKGKIDDCSCLHCRKNPYKFDKKRGHCIHNNMLLITDDMMSQEKLLKKSAYYKKLFVEGRHYNIMYLLCLNYSMGLTPTMRSNVDYVFLYAEEEVVNMKRLYENYAGIFPTFRMFKETLDQCTEDFGCLVIDKRSKSKVLTDRVFHFKAKDPGPFKYGNKEFWDKHYEHIGKKVSRNRPKRYRDNDHTNYKRNSENSEDAQVKRMIEMYGGKKYSIIKH